MEFSDVGRFGYCTLSCQYAQAVHTWEKDLDGMLYFVLDLNRYGIFESRGVRSRLSFINENINTNAKIDEHTGITELPVSSYPWDAKSEVDTTSEELSSAPSS